MAKITIGPQNIPSALEKGYSAALTLKMPNNWLRGRYPFRIPTMQTILGHPSATQIRQRATFKQCKDCFKLQPLAGGVEPPYLGPRNRSWWYTEASGSGLWYYNYFMKLSLPLYGAGVEPDWCFNHFLIEEMNRTDSLNPDDVFENEADLAIGNILDDVTLYPNYLWIQNQKLAAKRINLWIGDFWKASEPIHDIWLDVYNIPDGWAPGTLCWNNQPALGALLASKFMGGLDDHEYIQIDVPQTWEYVCVKVRETEEAYVEVVGVDTEWEDEEPFTSIYI